jgi:SAM-dependent methyltransferase
MGRAIHVPGAPSFRPLRVDTLEEFIRIRPQLAVDQPEANPAYPEEGEGEFSVPGYCWVDHAEVDFKCDFQYAFNIKGKRIPNWRERAICPLCGLNNRLRAAIHLFEQHLESGTDSSIYITEQVSPLYRWLQQNYAQVIGSEYLGEDCAPGSVNARGIRHEDLTRLSIADQSVDFLLSFDVFEHIPGYAKAFGECRRVLKPGGAMLYTVPFRFDAAEHLVRASFDEENQLIHHLPPQYHGDPVRPDAGVLCYQEFGWQLMSELRALGFKEAYALLYRSRALGYFGYHQIAFVARCA